MIYCASSALFTAAFVCDADCDDAIFQIIYH